MANDTINIQQSVPEIDISVANNPVVDIDIVQPTEVTISVDTDSEVDISVVPTSKLVNDYNDLNNKPKINDVTLQGNKTSDQLHLQDKLVSGTNIKTINEQSILGSGDLHIEAGVTSVNGRTGAVVLDKPDVNLGNVDNTSDLAKPISTATQAALDTKQATLVSGENIKTVNGQSILGSGDLPAGLVDDVKQNGVSIVQNKIANIILETGLGQDSSNSATVTAIRAFVNSSIEAVAAYYITATTTGDAFQTKAALDAGPWYYAGKPRTPTRNDYAIVIADETHQGKSARYCYTVDEETHVGQWSFQYTFNMSFTQAQIDAINSGISAAKVAIYEANNTLLTSAKSGGGIGWTTPEEERSVYWEGETEGKPSFLDCYYQVYSGPVDHKDLIGGIAYVIDGEEGYEFEIFSEFDNMYEHAPGVWEVYGDDYAYACVIEQDTTYEGQLYQGIYLYKEDNIYTEELLYTVKEVVHKFGLTYLPQGGTGYQYDESIPAGNIDWSGDTTDIYWARWTQKRPSSTTTNTYKFYKLSELAPTAEAIDDNCKITFNGTEYPLILGGSYELADETSVAYIIRNPSTGFIVAIVVKKPGAYSSTYHRFSTTFSQKHVGIWFIYDTVDGSTFHTTKLSWGTYGQDSLPWQKIDRMYIPAHDHNNFYTKEVMDEWMEETYLEIEALQMGKVDKETGKELAQEFTQAEVTAIWTEVFGA